MAPSSAQAASGRTRRAHVEGRPVEMAVGIILILIAAGLMFFIIRTVQANRA
jgi:hypothetical protein